MKDLVRQAATELIRDGFEVQTDLWLPHGFKLKEPYAYGSFEITGPCLHKHDDYMVNGIRITTYASEFSNVHINPFEELNHKSSFLYADPAFPQNLLHYVALGICDWLCWWDVFKEEGQIPER